MSRVRCLNMRVKSKGSFSCVQPLSLRYYEMLSFHLKFVYVGNVMFCIFSSPSLGYAVHLKRDLDSYIYSLFLITVYL